MRARLLGAVALGVALFQPSPAAACSCKKPIPSFWRAAEAGPVVVVGEVTRYIDQGAGQQRIGFEIRVVEVIKGNESRKTVELVNPRPTSCEMLPGAVDIGTRYAIVLRPGAVSEGAFSNCRPSISRIVEHMDGQGVTLDQLRLRLRGDAGAKTHDNRHP